MEPPASGTGGPLPHLPRQLLLQQEPSLSFQKGLTRGVGVTAMSPETAGTPDHLLSPEPLSPGAPQSQLSDLGSAPPEQEQEKLPPHVP